ncbi:MAG: agmatinase family protein [Nitrososphaerota archaeon]|nr:agmatinase family protein [Nitrososphaerota archaeon]MDG7024608.1 agmatinase family protein [Nitrososphaerota archaeon]
MRKPASYPVPSYSDPNDKRLVQIVRPDEVSQPKAVNILGVPFDGAVLGRKGAAGGPGAIRQVMGGFSNYNVELGVGLEDANVSDLGDLVLYDDDVEKVHSLVEMEVGKELRDDSLLVILGGDNSVSLPALRANAKKFGKLGLVVVDSHLDLRGELNGKPTSGSSYGLAIEEGILDPRNVVEVGAHGFLNARVYVDKAKRLGVRLFTAEELSRRGPGAVAREACALASRGTDAVYLSFDLDAVDLAQVSGVSAPSAGGMWARNAFVLMYEVAKVAKVKCADLVELAPALDPSGKSERVAAGALTYLIAGFVARNR